MDAEKLQKNRNLDVELDDFYRMSRVTGQGRHFLQLYYHINIPINTILLPLPDRH